MLSHAKDGVGIIILYRLSNNPIIGSIPHLGAELGQLKAVRPLVQLYVHTSVELPVHKRKLWHGSSTNICTTFHYPHHLTIPLTLPRPSVIPISLPRPSYRTSLITQTLLSYLSHYPDLLSYLSSYHSHYPDHLSLSQTILSCSALSFTITQNFYYPDYMVF